MDVAVATKQRIPEIPNWADPEDKEVTGELVGRSADAGRWEKFIGLLCDGGNVLTSLKTSGLRRAELEGAIRTDPTAKEQYENAKLVSIQRHWDMATVEDILDRLILCEQGGHLNRIVEDLGHDPASFYKLISRDPVVKEMYEEARQLQAEVMADKIREIADDGTNDTYVDQKGNVRVDQDVMGRSRIRVDTLKWVMSKLHHRRFGERLQTDQNVNMVVDHADKLESGRKRLEKLHAERAKGK